jgi:CheY-like chemotaxis protein
MPLTILVVEDDEGTRLSIQDYLDLEGYAVMTAKDGWEALERVEALQPQLIITDISMPRVDGYAFLKSLRQRPAWRLLPVVFLTAHAETRERVRGYQSGCDAYLEKPFELDELGAVVRNLLERSQLIQTALLQYTLAHPTPPAAPVDPPLRCRIAIPSPPPLPLRSGSATFWTSLLRGSPTRKSPSTFTSALAPSKSTSAACCGKPTPLTGQSWCALPWTTI